jgi:flagellar biosynthesis anti-sigma factor FlgM
MKITQKGPANTELSRLVQNDKTVGSTRRDGSARAQQSSESAKIHISTQARELQRIAELARKGDELRAEKVRQIKARVENGQYQVDSQEVSKSILRSEVASLFEKK